MSLLKQGIPRNWVSPQESLAGERKSPEGSQRRELWLGGKKNHLLEMGRAETFLCGEHTLVAELLSHTCLLASIYSEKI